MVTCLAVLGSWGLGLHNAIQMEHLPYLRRCLYAYLGTLCYQRVALVSCPVPHHHLVACLQQVAGLQYMRWG